MVEGWNKLWGMIPQSGAIGTVLAVIGVAIFAVYFVLWLWQRRKGGGGGFPWMAVIIAAVLAAPNVLIPVVLGLLDVVINLGAAVIKWFTGRF